MSNFINTEDGYFSLTQTGTICIGVLIVLLIVLSAFLRKKPVEGEHEKKEKKGFNLMGYDLLQRNVDCLKQGSIFFLIAQQPTLQGFDGIKALCEYLILKKEITRENFMPIDLLTKENIEFYYNK